MNDYRLLLYLIESSLCLVMLYLVYKYILYRYTYFIWNRYYLIAAAIVSLVIPFIHFPADSIHGGNWGIYDKLMIINPLSRESLFFVHENDLAQVQNSREFRYLTIWNMILVVYLSGIFRYSIELGKNIKKIIILIRKHPKQKWNSFQLVKTDLQQPAFTFLRYIFLGRKYDELSDEKKLQILKHEAVHAQQMHTVDILFFEILTIILWFNPVVWLMKSTLREIHEYIADNVVVDNKADGNYSRLLLQMSVRKLDKLLSSFSVSQLKKRISLLMTPESEQVRKLRFWITMPLIAFLIVVFGITKDVLRAANEIKPVEKATFIFPVTTNYKIVQPFYKNKNLSDFNKDKYNQKNAYNNLRVSHTQISIQVPEFTPVVAAADGIVQKISKYDNWGIYEYSMVIEHKNKFKTEYKKLYKIYKNKGDSVLQNEKIAITGDFRVFPVFSFRMLKDTTPVDPLKYIK